MVFSRFHRFRRQVFSLYDKNPLIMNSLVGGIVYVGGEMVIQAKNMKIKSDKDYFEILYDSMNWDRIAQVGALGTIQNGAVMLGWYHFLNITIGNGTETKIVLIKCLLDQLCFATQGDFLFLFICAYNDHKNIPAALNETKKTFVTTWIMDCAIWPLVNFLGFACIPYKLQPSYMSIVLFFWQLYMSSVATRSTNNITIQNDKKEEKTDSEESKLKYLFDKIDLKKCGMISLADLIDFLSQHKIPFNKDSILQKLVPRTSTPTRTSQSILAALPVKSQDLNLCVTDLKQIITFENEKQASDFWFAIYRNHNDKIPDATSATSTIGNAVNINLVGMEDKQESIFNRLTNISNYVVDAIMLTFDGRIDEERAIAIKNVIFGVSTLTSISLVRKIVFKL